MTKSLFFSVAIILFSFLYSCTPNVDIPKPSAGNADFHKSIAVGGDFMTGYQDGALYQDGQTNSIPAILAKQFEAVGGGTFNQPLVSDNTGFGLNAKPWVTTFESKNTLGYSTDCQGVTSLLPLVNTISNAQAAPYLQHISGDFQNLAVPFAESGQLFSSALGVAGGNGSNPFYARFASSPGTSTIYSDAVGQQASFFSVWLGMNDIFNYAMNGTYGMPLPSAAAFQMHLDSLLTGLTANGAKGVIANIPDVKDFSFFTTIPWNGVALTQKLADSLNNMTGNSFHFQAGNNGFVIKDTASAIGYRKMGAGEYILLTAPLDSMKCQLLGVLTALPDRYVLDSGQVSRIEQVTADYNLAISQEATKFGLAMVDMHSYMGTMATGITHNGVYYDASLVTGGFFSLDGYHPCQKGYAMLANEFIKAINQKYGSTISPVQVNDYAGIYFP